MIAVLTSPPSTTSTIAMPADEVSAARARSLRRSFISKGFTEPEHEHDLMIRRLRRESADVDPVGGFR
jgi:hypothetical protein